MRVDAILPAANVAADPAHRFEIDPAVLLAAHRAARAGGPEIVGHYHSHPQGGPAPSATDAAMAQGEDEIWLIVGDDGALGAWRASSRGVMHGRFSPLAIDLQDESGLAPAGPARH